MSSLAAKTAGSIDWEIDFTIIVDEDNKDDENEDNHGVNDDENEDDGDDVGMCEKDYDDGNGVGNDIHLGHHLCVAVDQVVAVQGGGQLHLDDDDDDDDDNDENDGYDK